MTKQQALALPLLYKDLIQKVDLFRLLYFSAHFISWDHSWRE
jgi:hypothetical protein